MYACYVMRFHVPRQHEKDYRSSKFYVQPFTVASVSFTFVYIYATYLSVIAVCDRKLSVRINTDDVLVVKTTMQIYIFFGSDVTRVIYLVSMMISFVRINTEKRERKIVVTL